MRDETAAAAFGRVVDRPVAVGEFLAEPPCIPEIGLAEYRRAGRPCPRVELDPENAEAFELVELGLAEHCRPLMGAFAAAALADRTPDESATIIRRAAAALRAPEVLAILYPPPAQRGTS